MPSNEEDVVPFVKKVDDSPSYVLDLKRRQKELTYKCKFNPGDVIVWKEGLRNKLVPDYGVPGIVVNVFFPMITDADQEPLSAYFNEQLDIQVGFITKDDDFVMFSQDSRRYKLYEPSI